MDMFLKRIGEWFRRRENLLALLIALVILVVHLSIINQVEEPIYDAKSYVGEANMLRAIAGQEIDDYYYDLAVYMGYETMDEYKELGYVQHGPLSKLFMVAGIQIFGDNPWGWRFFNVLFGVVAIIIFYLICQRLTTHRWLPLIATFIFAFENMCFVMSGIATLDAIAFTLMLTSFLVYLRGNYVLAGVMLAFAATAKEMVALGGGVILFHWFLSRRTSNWDGVRFLLAAPLAYLIILPVLDYIALREFMYPWDHIHGWFSHTGGAASWTTLSEDYLRSYNAIHPWEWVFIPKTLFAHCAPDYEITLSWTLWGLMIPVICYAGYEAVRQRWNSFCLFALLWFAWLYLPWLVIDLGFHKVSYAYHYYHVVGALCLAAGYVIWKLFSLALETKNMKLGWAIKTLLGLWMIAHFALFWVMAPVS